MLCSIPCWIIDSFMQAVQTKQIPVGKIIATIITYFENWKYYFFIMVHTPLILLGLERYWLTNIIFNMCNKIPGTFYWNIIVLLLILIFTKLRVWHNISDFKLIWNYSHYHWSYQEWQLGNTTDPCPKQSQKETRSKEKPFQCQLRKGRAQIVWQKR